MGHERHTFLFEHAIIDLLKVRKNQTKTTHIISGGLNVVNRIMHLNTERVKKRRKYSQLTFNHFSIDEKSYQKGHCYITLLSHPLSEYILDVEEEEERNKESCKKMF